MSIASEITRLQGVKSDILTAIADKGVTVPAGSALDDCPGLIGDIQANVFFQIEELNWCGIITLPRSFKEYSFTLKQDNVPSSGFYIGGAIAIGRNYGSGIGVVFGAFNQSDYTVYDCTYVSSWNGGSTWNNTPFYEYSINNPQYPMEVKETKEGSTWRMYINNSLIVECRNTDWDSNTRFKFFYAGPYKTESTENKYIINDFSIKTSSNSAIIDDVLY